jgi:cation:H+ antiporter
VSEMLLRMLTGHGVVVPLIAFALTAVAVFLVGSRLAIVLTAIAGAALASGGWFRIGPVGFETLLILAIYLLGMRAVYGNMRATAPPDQLQLGETSRTLLRTGLAGFGLATVGLLITAPLLVLTAEAVSVELALTQSFVGTLLVGFTTSLPEMAATFAAIRLGAFDLAVGNMLGSNAFNMCILLAMDVAYRSGSVLEHASQDHLLSALLALVATGLAMLGILARRGQRFGPVRIESVLIVLTYAGALTLLALGHHG